MALTEDDVRLALSDPVLQRMDFWVDSVHVRGEAYTKIADLIEDEQILVVPGTDPNHSEYFFESDTIMTQKASPPADLINRSAMIHECTHAIADMERATVTHLSNEAAARIAQATYLLVSSPNPAIPPIWKRFIDGAIKLAQKFNLDTAPGAGTKLSFDDILPFINQINREPHYHEKRDQRDISNGISEKPRKKMKIKGSPEVGATHATYHPMLAHNVPTDVLFDFDRDNIKPGAEPALREAADIIKEFNGPGVHIYITGHTDSKGDPAYNRALSKRRAEAVARWLITNKFVEPASVITTGEGASKPLVPNKRPDGSDDPVGMARNRRVDVRIM